MHIIHLGGDSPPTQMVQTDQLKVELASTPTQYYHHGWQSWSLAAWTDATLRLPPQKPYFLHPLHIDPQWGFHPRPHSSWVGAARLPDGQVVLLGSIGLDAHVELDGNALHGWCESGSVAWFIARGEETAVFSAYAGQLGQKLGKRRTAAPGGVWCSWYSLYTDIDEALLSRVFGELDDLPFDVFQVDDGWQQAAGEWEPNAKFPGGMAALAQRIKAKGRRAGLWLAPLIAVRSSQLFRSHPDWFLRDAAGRLVSAGRNWGDQLYALDTTRSEVLDWLRQLMQRVRTWGFDYIKLDFLYGGALPGKRYREMPREAALRQALQTLRDAMGEDAFFLGCGVPILPSLGICDAIRIGPDVWSEWESHRDAKLLHNWAVPGGRNAIRTSVNRLWLKPLIIPDPDVVYFRSYDCGLSDEQKRHLQDLALICGFRATSDLPRWLTAQERGQMRYFLTRTPRVEQLGPRSFRIDGTEVDYSAAAGLPNLGSAWDALASAAFGLLANRAWALRIDEWLRKRAARKRESGL